MSPAKAIEILSLILSDEAAVWDPDSRDALHLAIASLNLYRTIEEYIQTQAELISHLKEVTKP